MRRKDFVSPQLLSIVTDMEYPVMAGSVIEKNNMIKAASQELTFIDVENNPDEFYITWE